MRRLSLLLSSLLALSGLLALAGACGADQRDSVSVEEGPSAKPIVVLERGEPTIMAMDEVERLAGFRPLQLEDGPGGFRLEERIASPEGSIVSMTYTRSGDRDVLHIVQWKRVPGEPLDRFLIEALRGEPVAVDGEAGHYLPAELGVRPFDTLVFERGGITVRIVAFPLAVSRELLVDIAASLA